MRLKAAPAILISKLADVCMSTLQAAAAVADRANKIICAGYFIETFNGEGQWADWPADGNRSQFIIAILTWATARAHYITRLVNCKP